MSEPADYGPKPEMSLIGYAVAALALLVMVPLVPFIAVAWLLWRLVGPRETAGHAEAQVGAAGRPPSGA